MNDVTNIKRSPAVIAAEIRFIKERVATEVANGAFEIGRRLCEVKDQIPYGEWGQWLRDNVDYSETTAQDAMRLYREYGSEQINLLLGTSPADLFGGISPSKLLAMAPLSEEDRARLVTSGEINDLSVRDIKALVLENKRLNEEAAKASEEIKELGESLDASDSDLSALRDEYNQSRETVAEQTRRISALDARLSEANEALMKANKKIDKLKNEPPKTVEVIRNEPTEEQITAIRAEADKAAEEKWKASFESLSGDLETREKALAEAKAEAQKEADEKIAVLREQIRTEYESEMEKLRLRADKHAAAVNFLVAEIREKIQRIGQELDGIEAEDPERALKLRTAVAKAIVPEVEKITK